MKIPPGATNFCPEPRPFIPGRFEATTLCHTFRPKGTRDWLLIYTTDGSGRYRYADGEFNSGANDVTLYAPGAFQDYQINPKLGKWDIYFVHFLAQIDWLPLLDWPLLGPGFMKLSLDESPVRERVQERWKEMIYSHYSHHASQQLLGLNALEEILIWCHSVSPRTKEAVVDSRMGLAVDYIRGHLAEPFSIIKLGKAAGLSASRMGHLFREQLGISPRFFQEQERLRRAKELLAMSRRTIAEVAYDVGFSNPFYFTLRFKKQTGESPSAYRQRMRQG